MYFFVFYINIAYLVIIIIIIYFLSCVVQVQVDIVSSLALNLPTTKYIKIV